ncbi:hypothetical protein F0562_031202 [Nyssa sinensis]|uniref:ferric-chelate reductase (NADH) n=1 Tax=Nyssa sinensis TaxID=561372 RepID=A0A5J5ARH5_9ASTE|nr:hypothetical protein F0562_031202 [Nyssa sinensis]
MILPGVFLFLIDRYLRFLQSRQRVTLVSARILPCGTVELNFSKSPELDYNPTSMLFVNAPSISKLQWHPFTVTSNCNMEPDRFSITIKSEGSWTQKLYQELSSSTDHLEVSIEGPYGPASSHFLRRESLVMISGGSGITTFISVIREIIFRSTQPNSRIPQILLICAFKNSTDLTMLDLLLPISGTPLEISQTPLHIEAYVTRETEQPTADNQKLLQTKWFKPNPMDSAISAALGPNSWLWLGGIISSSFIMFLLLLAILTRYYIFPIDHNTNMIYHLTLRTLWDISFVCVCIFIATSAIFLWQKRQISMEKKQTQNLEVPTPTISPGSWLHGADRELESLPHQSLVQATNVHFGTRPDLKKILLECKGSDVGVMVCGPRKMRHEVAKICSSGLVDNLHFESISFTWCKHSDSHISNPINCYFGVFIPPSRKEMLKWAKVGVSNVAGEVALLSGLAMWVTSFPRIRRKIFELFFYTHHLYILFILFFVLHVGFSVFSITLPGFYLFLIDRYLRALQSQQKVRLVSARVLPCEAVELNFLKSPGLSYNPTSSAFINVPGISKLQWHPFTITSNSNMDPEKLSIVIKCEGSWSKKLYQKLSSPSPVDRLEFSIEGPYGPVSNHFLRHDKLVMVSGGSGFTPFISIIREILFIVSTTNCKTPQILLITAFKKSVDLTMLDLLLPVSASGISYDISHLQVQIEAYVTRQKEPITEHDKRHQTLWFKPSALDAPVSAILGSNSWLWLGAIISSSFVIFLLSIGLITRYYIYPIDHNTNMIYSYSAISALNLLFICISIATTATAAFLWNKIHNAKEFTQIQNKDAPTRMTSPGPGPWFHNADRELESLPNQSFVQATKVHYGERPNLKSKKLLLIAHSLIYLM